MRGMLIPLGLALLTAGIVGLAVGGNEQTVAAAAVPFSVLGFLSLAAGVVLTPIGILGELFGN